jgi:hypothetical protein
MIKRVEERDGMVFYSDVETNVKYLRIIGGLAWPAAKPGFVVAIGEEFDIDLSLRVHHLRVLAKAEDFDLNKLFQKCIDLRGRFKVEGFYGDTESEGMMEILRRFNQKLKEEDFHAVSLNLRMAEFPKDLKYHSYVIKERIQRDTKTLFFDEANQWEGYLLPLDREEILEADISQYPAIAALGYSVAHIKSRPRDPARERLERISEAKEKPYNPFTFGLPDVNDL